MNQKLDVLGNSKKAKVTTVALIVFLIGYGAYQVAYAMPAGGYKVGYKWGLSDGKKNIRDSLGTCDNDNSSLSLQCQAGYDVGFREGCAIEAVNPVAPIPEFASCAEHFQNNP